jgi:hypothetical protein
VKSCGFWVKLLPSSKKRLRLQLYQGPGLSRFKTVLDRAVRAVARAVESNKNLRVQKTGLAYLSNISMEARD